MYNLLARFRFRYRFLRWLDAKLDRHGFRIISKDVLRNIRFEMNDLHHFINVSGALQDGREPRHTRKRLTRISQRLCDAYFDGVTHRTSTY